MNFCVKFDTLFIQIYIYFYVKNGYNFLTVIQKTPIIFAPIDRYKKAFGTLVPLLHKR